jgi:hypothetical protein
MMHELRGEGKESFLCEYEFKQSLRASILRGHGLRIDVARKLADGRVHLEPLAGAPVQELRA